MDTKDLLIILVENPELGKVKTRLAKTIGDERALETYLSLLTHTYAITNALYCDKAVFYSNSVKENDFWETAGYEQHLQKGIDQGDHMINAFKMGFKRRYKNVVIIRSDCYELSKAIIQEAFNELDEHSVVIGPATDSGYYLIGMTILYKELFKNKEWNSENVLLDTMIDLKKLDLSFKLLKTLTIVDEEKDLVTMRKSAKKPHK